MWLVTARGFYSVVEDLDGRERLLVRARVRRDLEALADLIPGLAVEETPERDYRFRASVTREAWAAAAVELAREIDYPNFKNEVARRQGGERAHLYAEVWVSLLRLQQSPDGLSGALERG